MGQDIVAAVTEFFSTCKFPPACNSTFTALIPKIHDVKIIKDFRLISLIVNIYKIIAKILANRLSLVILDLINEVQIAFVPNRQILDGPFILNELISWCKHKKVNTMIFKVDFKKAFDSIRWVYLDHILKSFGFGDTWRSWIFGCLNFAKRSVIINRSPTLEFQFYKGLKKGDPLSLFLFILVMESLHRSFSRVMEAGLFKGISINNSLSISHLFYADDAVIVGEWNIPNIKTIVDVLNYFFMASGLKIILHKRELSRIGVSKAETDLAASIVGCSTFSPHFLYLGVKIEASMSRIISWKEVTDKISSRLDFFHGADKVDRKIVWVCWEKVLESKNSGGLGVSSLYATSGLFFSNGYGDLSLTVLPSGLVSLKQFMELKETSMFLKKRSADLYARRNGENTLFWEDIWHGDSALKMTHSRLFALELKKDIIVAEKMSNAYLNLSFLRLPRSGIEDEKYKNLVSVTSDVLFPQMHDRWSWPLNASGDFTIRLPTRFNLSSRGLEIHSILCPLCNVVVETTSHIFFSCSLSRYIMHTICRWWELDISSFNSYVEWFNWLSIARIAKREKEILEGIFGELVVGELVVGDLVGELVVGELMVGELMTGLLFLFILAVKASGRV
ncbi:RNA-directed DNA polymerase, eukaryota, reverse transcriptase zinc-binding domain protein [Tanacetum coccineum]